MRPATRGRVGRAAALAAGLLAAHLSLPAPAGAAPPTAEEQLSLALPEVVVESPTIERLIARRVRPVPPGRLGVRLPDILVRAETPGMALPPRPLPPEREPDPELTQLLGRLTRLFADDEKLFETGLAYVKKGAPVEALSFFERAAESTQSPKLKAAALFWAAEALVRLDRAGEARERRERLLSMPPQQADPYAAAARYALAEASCKRAEYATCLRLLDGRRWAAQVFGGGRARYLRAWALVRVGARARALDVLGLLAADGGPSGRRALVALGNLRLEAREYMEAGKRFSQAEAAGPAAGEGVEDLLGQALHGLGWVRLHLGEPEAAARAFALFFRRHPGHPLSRSAEAGALVARIEAAPAGEGEAKRLLDALGAFLAKYPGSPHEGPLRLQLAWALFRRGDHAAAARLAAAVSDDYPLGRIYRIGRIIEGLSHYHLGRVKRAYGVLRLGADRPPTAPARLAERSAARSAAMATAFAAFRLRDFGGAMKVLRHWAFAPGGDGPSRAADPEAALWYGEAAFEAGELDEARRAFAAVPAKAAEGYRARAGLAWIHYRRREWGRAAAAFDAVFEADPKGPLAAEALARAGEARFNAGDYEGALRAFEAVERKYAGEEAARKALFERGKLLFRRDRFEEARRAFVRYLKRYPNGAPAAEVEFWHALIPFRRGDFPRAREMLLAFARRRPDSPLAAEAYLRTGDAFYNEGRYLEADRLYRLMMTRFPRHRRVREAAYGLILTRLQREDYPRFLRGARSFIERYPDDELSITLAFQIGEVYLTRGNLEGAFRAYREVEARYADSDLAAHALLRISGIHRRQGNIDAALDAYESLLARHPKSRLVADALFGAGETLARIGRCAEARTRLEAFLKRHPGHDYALLARYEAGRCAARLGDEAAAFVHLGKVVEAKENVGEGLRSGAALLLAALHSKRGEWGAAERAVEVALLSPDPAVAAEAAFGRAEILVRRGDPAAAAEFLKLTYRYPDQTMWVVRALARAGELYEKAGNRTTALRIFLKMRQVAPAGALRETAEEAVRRLSGASAPRP